MDDVLAGFGVGQALAGEALHQGPLQDRVLKGMKLDIEFFRHFGFGLDLFVKFQLFFAHPLVLLHDRFVKYNNRQHAGDDQKDHYRPRQLIPNAVIDIQRPELNTASDKMKDIFEKNLVADSFAAWCGFWLESWRMVSSARALRLAFIVLVASLAVFQFSENTADPDLWGHITFGRQIIHDAAIPRSDLYSWTVRGRPWINHEWMAEIALGGAHQLLGGGGVLLLKMAVGLLTFALAVRLGSEGLSWPARFVTWTVAALAAVEISYGFAARPQIFTALALAAELWLLRRIHAGKWTWAFALPALFVFWINTHGGALAGFALLGLATAATTAQSLWTKNRAVAKTVAVLCLATAASAGALFCNPWGIGLLRWLAGSVSWMRPEIAEWNSTPFGWDHAALYILAALTVFGWLWTRRPVAWWEAAACATFVFLGIKVVRHAPLCGVVVLSLLPHHLADALERFRGSFARLEAAASQPGLQKCAIILSCFGTVGALIGTFLLHKEHPLTMEIPRSQYPVAAFSFIQEAGLSGKMLAFFDWGEEAIFELPDCPPSIDGRLDTCYPRELIAEHWKLYNGEAVNTNILDFQRADLAIFPLKLAGTAALARRPEWRPVYLDSLAAVLVREPERFPKLRLLTLPVEGPKTATEGRAPFPKRGPRPITQGIGGQIPKPKGGA